MKLAVIALFVSAAALAQPKDGEGHRRGPPAEALAACEGKAQSAVCSFSHDGRSLEGTCFSPSTDRPLACRPTGMPDHPPRD
jgi:hypothetical protein